MAAGFLFTDGNVQQIPGRGYVAHVPSGIYDRHGLFSALKAELQFPSYFGDNWDALADCLRDLSWISEHRVIIWHDELPRMDDQSLRIYLSVLLESIKDWKEGEAHELVVIFPPDSQARATSLVAASGNSLDRQWD